DLQTGRAEKILENLPLPIAQVIGAWPRLSPDGRSLVYLQEESYMACDVPACAAPRNLTSALPVRFFNRANYTTFIDRRQDGFPIIQGWSHDGASVLLSDTLDLWQLPLHGGSARNLTVNGRASGFIYGLLAFDTFGSRPLPVESVRVKDPLYFQVIDP